MTISRPPRDNHGSLPPSKGEAVDRRKARPISPPTSSQSANGSSPLKSERRVLKSGSQRLGDREKVRSVSTDHSEPGGPLGATLHRQQSEASLDDPDRPGKIAEFRCADLQQIGWDASTTKSPTPPYSAQSSLSQDGLLPGNGGGVTGANRVTQEEKIKILKLCHEHRMALLDCPTASISSDEEFWELILEMIKAQVRPDLPRRWSKWSAVKELVNLSICRNRRDRTSGRHPPPQRNESAVVHELDFWIDQWNQVWRLREALVYGAKFFTALKCLLGASDIEDLIDDQTEESDSSTISPHISICLPQVQEAIRHRHRQLEESPRGAQSGSAGGCDGDGQCRVSDNGSSSDGSIETSPGAAEKRDALEEAPNISRPGSPMLSVASKEMEAEATGLVETKSLAQEGRQARSASRAGSVVLGSTPPAGIRREKETAEMRSMRSSSLYPPKPCSDIAGHCARADSTDEDLPDLTALFSGRSSGNRQNTEPGQPSSSNQTASDPDNAVENPSKGETVSTRKRKTPSKKEGMHARQGKKPDHSHEGNAAGTADDGTGRNGTRDHALRLPTTTSYQPVDIQRGTSRNHKAERTTKPHTTQNDSQTQNRSTSRTPVLITRENERWSRKHPKPLAPVSISYRAMPARQPSPTPGQTRPSHPEITPNEFYGLLAGKSSGMQATQSAAESDGCSSTRCPPFTRPTSTPRKAFNYYEVTPSITGGDPTPETAQRSKPDPSGLKRSQVTDKLGSVTSDSELWYNQDTGISLRDQNMKHEAIGQGRADLLGVQASSEREPLWTMRPASTSRAASQASNVDSLRGSGQLGGASCKPNVPSGKEANSPHSVTGARTAITACKSKKRRRTDSFLAESSRASGSLASSEITNSLAVPASSESPSSSVTRPNKRRKRQQSQQSSDGHRTLELPSDWHSKSTPSPVTPKRRADTTSPGKLDANSGWTRQGGSGYRKSGPAHDNTWSGPKSGQLWRSSPYNEPSSSPTAKRRRNKQSARLRRNRYKTPAPSTTNSPASSGLFVSPESQSPRISFQATHIRQTEDTEAHQASGKPDEFVRESTDSTEAFLRCSSPMQRGHLHNTLKKLKQECSRVKRRLDALDSKAGLR
ncbi:hypothetical protein DL764_007196 [Monosporascus ibericus]|uniref:Uncharacterized protein n=1 Tax=Monosporascus ibericus TaxID=155417 RepID=A0A4Q4T4S0_9PEZI|nr:hypothetical protein DL764_007196 [Monosporascus ibericus]